MVQKTVSNVYQGTGVVGEFYTNTPQRTQAGILASDSAALNVVGVVLHHVDGEDNQVGVAADGAFAGILIDPKTMVREGLDAVTAIKNGIAVEYAEQGYVIVDLPAAADIGDFVYYSDTDGTLITAAPTAIPAAGHTRLPGGTVQIKNVTTAGLGIIYLDSAGDTTIITA